MTDLLFADLPHARRREATSAIAHFVAGVLDRQAMESVIQELCRSASFSVGDRVQSLRGSLRGIVTRIEPDGRLVVRPDGSRGEMICLPESLLPEP